MLSVQADVTEAFSDAFGFLRSRGHETAFSYLDKPLPWNGCVAKAVDATGFRLIHQLYEDSVQTCFDYIAEQRPGAILLNGQSLYPLLDMIRGMEDYKPDLVIGVDEFHCFLESPLIVGGIRTSTAEKARRGIQELIRRVEEPGAPREGIIPLTPGKFIDFTSGNIPVMSYAGAVHD